MVISKTEKSTWADALKTGEINVYEGIADGTEVNTVMDMIDAGAELKPVQYDRAGYGKIQFFCDVTPTQFKEVRHAIAMLCWTAPASPTPSALAGAPWSMVPIPPLCGSIKSPRTSWLMV